MHSIYSIQQQYKQQENSMLDEDLWIQKNLSLLTSTFLASKQKRRMLKILFLRSKENNMFNTTRLAKELKIAEGSVRYHMKELLLMRIVRTVKHRRYERFWIINDAQYPKWVRIVLRKFKVCSSSYLFEKD